MVASDASLSVNDVDAGRFEKLISGGGVATVSEVPVGPEGGEVSSTRADTSGAGLVSNSTVGGVAACEAEDAAIGSVVSACSAAVFSLSSLCTGSTGTTSSTEDDTATVADPDTPSAVV